MSDLVQIVGLILGIFALVVGLLVLLTRLEASLYTDRVVPAPAPERVPVPRSAPDQDPGASG